MTIVPNCFPSIPDIQGRKLAIVGEAPGSDEVLGGQPFIGPSGKLLRLVLEHSGITTQSVFFGNICQHQPPDNAIENFAWDSPEITSGIAQLEQDLAHFAPNCILALGRTAFRYFHPAKCYQGKPNKGNPTGYVIPIQDWRGSVFVGTGGYKTVAAFHPAYILRAFNDIPYFRSDVARAVRHSAFRDLRATERTGLLRPALADVLSFLQRLRANHTPASFDIEGYSDALGVTMLSICDTPTSGIVVPFWLDGTPYWSEDEEAIVWAALSGWLADPLAPKKGHNLLYETSVLGWRHSCVIDGIVSDTMFKHWEVFNELEKSLAVATSIWIEEPYYKDEREAGSSDVKLNYNFKDSACTEEIDRAIEPVLQRTPAAYDHFKLNVALIHPYTYTHLRGCKFDSARAAEHKRAAEVVLDELNEKINLVTRPVLGKDFNVKSVPDKQWLLYDFLGHTPYKRYGTSTKEEILHRFYNKRKDEVLRNVIQAVGLRTRISDIEKLTPHPDGRIRTSYGVVDTATGRLNSRESSITEIIGVTKDNRYERAEFGTNLQNVTKALRDAFIPDNPDMLFWQADLAGADAWTVAADLAALGAPHMLEDLRAGVKPSKLLLRMLDELEAGRDPSVLARLSSTDARIEADKVIVPEGLLPDGRPADWKYTSMKRVQHGTNYDGQAETISATIFKDSDGAIDVPPREIEKYQYLYRLRYHTALRSQWMSGHLVSTGGVLETACGIRRRFYGIRNPRTIDADVVRAALASEPQAITTNRTNVALLNLWNDVDNRRRTGALFVEPLLQIHDALAGQFPTRLRSFARDKIKLWFNNPIKIHGVEVTIPVDIKVGSSWGTCKETI